MNLANQRHTFSSGCRVKVNVSHLTFLMPVAVFLVALQGLPVVNCASGGVFKLIKKGHKVFRRRSEDEALHNRWQNVPVYQEYKNDRVCGGFIVGETYPDEISTDGIPWCQFTVPNGTFCQEQCAKQNTSLTKDDCEVGVYSKQWCDGTAANVCQCELCIYRRNDTCIGKLLIGGSLKMAGAPPRMVIGFTFLLLGLALVW